LCGVIFDAPQHRARLKALEARIAAPDFWNNQEEAQNVLRQRKVADDQINADEKLGKLNGDIETYIELVQAETNAEQREDVLKELSRELIRGGFPTSANWKRKLYSPAKTITSMPS